MTRGGRSTSHFKDLFRGGTIFKRHRARMRAARIRARLGADARLNFNFASRITHVAQRLQHAAFIRCIRGVALDICHSSQVRH